MSTLQRSLRLQRTLRASSCQVRHFTYPTKVPSKNPFDLPPQPQSNDSTSVTRGKAKDESSLSEEVDGIPRRHQLDYNVATDYRTSTFSPIPMRVMDGSEPGPTVPAAVLSGAPVDLQARMVRISRPAKTATQSGDWHSHAWQMDWDPLPKGYRWENPLMGWQSSADVMQGEKLSFKTKEDAVAFAEKQGYEYFVQEPNERRFVPKAYANNFLHQAKKLKKIPTK